MSESSEQRVAGSEHVETSGILIRFGSRVRDYPKNSRMSLGDLANRSGLGKGHLSRIENGLANVSLDTIHKLAKGLQVGVTELIC